MISFSPGIFPIHIRQVHSDFPLNTEKSRDSVFIDQESEVMGKLNLFLADDYRQTGDIIKAREGYRKAERILSKLVGQGDQTSKHWLDAIKKRYLELEKEK